MTEDNQVSSMRQMVASLQAANRALTISRDAAERRIADLKQHAIEDLDANGWKLAGYDFLKHWITTVDPRPRMPKGWLTLPSEEFDKVVRLAAHARHD